MSQISNSVTPLIGAHVSAAGGIQMAVERAANIGCNCVQIFSASPRIWARPALESIDQKKVADAQAKFNISPIVTHALYLVNLASENQESVEKSIKVINFDLEVDARLNGAGVVVHVGSHQGRGWETVREQVAEAITTILKNAPQNSTFLIENSAGQNGKIGTNFEEIRWLLDQVKSPQLGWCLDTCHAWAAGYALNAGYVPSDELASKHAHRADILDEIERLNLFDALKCLHVNDSRDPFGSGRDRHANLGDGTIPTTQLQPFLLDSRLAKIPKILEVPGIEGEGPDAENVKRLKTLLQVA